MTFKLNYDDAIHLDAEDLAETGLGLAYDRLLPHLRKYVGAPAEIEQVTDNDLPSYSIKYSSPQRKPVFDGKD